MIMLNQSDGDVMLNNPNVYIFNNDSASLPEDYSILCALTAHTLR